MLDFWKPFGANIFKRRWTNNTEANEEDISLQAQSIILQNKEDSHDDNNKIQLLHHK